MKSRVDSEEMLVRAVFKEAIGNVPNRMPSVDSIRTIVGRMPAAGRFAKKNSRNYSAMPLAAALALVLVMPAFFADKSESLSDISAKAARNGSLQRCGESLVFALTEGGKSLGFGE